MNSYFLQLIRTSKYYIIGYNQYKRYFDMCETWSVTLGGGGMEELEEKF